MCDDVRGHDSVHVLAGRFVTDLVNECERITCPGETMEGECSCPAEVVHHSDGNVYAFEEVVAGEVVSQMCGANMTGYVSRSCSLYGGWSAIRSMCKHVQAHSVSGGAAERVRVAGDEQWDGGASAMQRVNDGLRVAHVRSDGRVERA